MPRVCPKNELLEVRGEKQEVRDYHLWLTDFITRLVVGTYPVYVRKTILIDKSRIREFEIFFQHELPGIDHELNMNYGMLKHRNYHYPLYSIRRRTNCPSSPKSP